MNNNIARNYPPVSTKPVKRFFVDMLTRDIAIEDAILDLLDNCLDGILRTLSLQEGEVVGEPNEETPYNGFWANITVNRDLFVIEDNCGGIPWTTHERAFRMGRPAVIPEQAEQDIPLSVGAYGIGMKRAIFKLGNDAVITTKHQRDSYQIPISSAWMNDEENWDLDVFDSSTIMEEDGTNITIRQLNEGVTERFSADTFPEDLIDKIESHYAVIINKGFTITVNDIVAEPAPIAFKFSPLAADPNGDVVRPYMFRNNYNGVDVFVAVGLREPIPDAEQVLDDQEGVRYSSEYAGWTIICNDRVVLYCNRDELTGWGTAGIPRYHTQFIAISGVVEFRGDPKRLPTTTTKRGLEFGTPIYQQTLNRMREGLRIFINFTNRWKTREEESKRQVLPVPTISYTDLKRTAINDVRFHQLNEGSQYRPRLPLPPDNRTDVRISYTREVEKVITLAERLVPDFETLRDNEVARRVGEATFDYVYEHFNARDME